MNTPVRDFNIAVGYKVNNPIQGFSVLDADRSELALDFFEFDIVPRRWS